MPSVYTDCEIQTVFVPDTRGGRLYVALARVKEQNLWFCSLSSNPVQWHSELELPITYQFSDYTLTVYGSKLVVIGGTLFNSCPIDQVWSLNSVKSEWNDLPPMLTSRSSVAAVGYGDHLVAAGGKCGKEVCHKVEVFNGDKWTLVKPFPYPKSLKGLTSVLHTDKRWYIMETSGSDVRATYSTPIEDIICDSSSYEWRVHPAESCPPCGRLPPISFDGQLIVIGNNGGFGKPKLYFCSPVTNSWVSFENATYIGQYRNIVGIASLSHQKEMMLVYKGSTLGEESSVKRVTCKGKISLQVYCLGLQA